MSVTHIHRDVTTTSRCQIPWVLAWCSQHAQEPVGSASESQASWAWMPHRRILYFHKIISQCRKTMLLHRRVPSCPAFSILAGEGSSSHRGNRWRSSHKPREAQMTMVILTIFSDELDIWHLGKSHQITWCFLEIGNTSRDSIVSSYSCPILQKNFANVHIKLLIHNCRKCFCTEQNAETFQQA